MCFLFLLLYKEILEGKQNSIETVISITILGIVFIGFAIFIAIFIIKTLISDSKPENKPKSIFDDYYNSSFENNDNTNDDISTHHS
jgi:RsiW-degrading membrane proteinase PrsW (M82 family)